MILGPVVLTLDNAFHRINYSTVDKCYGNQLRYPVNSDVSSVQSNLFNTDTKGTEPIVRFTEVSVL